MASKTVGHPQDEFWWRKEGNACIYSELWPGRWREEIQDVRTVPRFATVKAIHWIRWLKWVSKMSEANGWESKPKPYHMVLKTLLHGSAETKYTTKVTAGDNEVTTPMIKQALQKMTQEYLPHDAGWLLRDYLSAVKKPRTMSLASFEAAVEELTSYLPSLPEPKVRIYEEDKRYALYMRALPGHWISDWKKQRGKDAMRESLLDFCSLLEMDKGVPKEGQERRETRRVEYSNCRPENYGIHRKSRDRNQEDRRAETNETKKQKMKNKKELTKSTAGLLDRNVESGVLFTRALRTRMMNISTIPRIRKETDRRNTNKMLRRRKYEAANAEDTMMTIATAMMTASTKLDSKKSLCHKKSGSPRRQKVLRGHCAVYCSYAHSSLTPPNGKILSS